MSLSSKNETSCSAASLQNPVCDRSGWRQCSLKKQANGADTYAQQQCVMVFLLVNSDPSLHAYGNLPLHLARTGTSF